MRLPLETIPPFLSSLVASCSFLKKQIGVLLETVLKRDGWRDIMGE
jgi:hypothetical protein